MNNQLIEKIITANNLPCPEFTYENPVLDRNVAKALSKSFVKILNLSQRNSKVNNNLRESILENIRKMCQIEPENHLKVDENITSVLLEFYEQNMTKDSRTSDSDSTEKILDAFLIRNLKDMSINSSYNTPFKPEVVQALINLNRNGLYLDILLKDIVHWDCTENKNIRILRDIWSSDYVNSTSNKTDDVSIKFKAEIEKVLLEICHHIMGETDSNIDVMFMSDKSLKNLVKKCSESANCFQICCGILNYLFIMTNFDKKFQIFVQTFIRHVKENCLYITFAVLYPIHLNPTVILLDIELELLPSILQNDYVQNAKKYLNELGSKSENELIMLLSHFPQWFDIYFK